MKSCVIFAVSIFEESKLHVLKEFLDTFKANYSDCDFYIGINHGSVENVESIIDSYNLNCFVQRNSLEMYCRSDASAYQTALKILKQSKKSYDLYWFAHTKGGVHERSYERHLYLSELFGNRWTIQDMFNKHKYLGSYALRSVSGGAAGDRWETYNHDHYIEICSNIITDNLPCTHINWSYIETMYVIRNKPIETFFNLADNKFYETKIEDDNRWYFETIFPWIVSRTGYFPYVKQKHCFFDKSINLLDITKNWIIKNSLNHLDNYLSL